MNVPYLKHLFDVSDFEAESETKSRKSLHSECCWIQKAVPAASVRSQQVLAMFQVWLWRALPNVHCGGHKGEIISDKIT